MHSCQYSIEALSDNDRLPDDGAGLLVHIKLVLRFIKLHSIGV